MWDFCHILNIYIIYVYKTTYTYIYAHIHWKLSTSFLDTPYFLLENYIGKLFKNIPLMWYRVDICKVLFVDRLMQPEHSHNLHHRHRRLLPVRRPVLKPRNICTARDDLHYVHGSSSSSWMQWTWKWEPYRSRDRDVCGFELMI